MIRFPLERVNTDLELKNEIEPHMREDIHSWYQVMNANSQPFQSINPEETSTMTVKVKTLTNLCAEVAQDLVSVFVLYQEVCYRKYTLQMYIQWTLSLFVK